MLDSKSEWEKVNMKQHDHMTLRGLSTAISKIKSGFKIQCCASADFVIFDVFGPSPKIATCCKR